MDDSPAIPPSIEARFSGIDDTVRGNFAAVRRANPGSEFYLLMFAIARRGRNSTTYFRYLCSLHPELDAIYKERPNVFSFILSQALNAGRPFSTQEKTASYKLAAAIAEDLGVPLSELKPPEPRAPPPPGTIVLPDDYFALAPRGPFRPFPPLAPPLAPFTFTSGGKTFRQAFRDETGAVRTEETARKEMGAMYPNCLVPSFLTYLAQAYYLTGSKMTAGEAIETIPNLDRLLAFWERDTKPLERNRVTIVDDLEKILLGGDVRFNDRAAALVALHGFTGLHPALLESELKHGLLRRAARLTRDTGVERDALPEYGNALSQPCNPAKGCVGVKPAGRPIAPG